MGATVVGDTALRIRGLTKSFGQTNAVDGFDLDLEHGKTLALLGGSGCGKTTVLRLVAGFERPDGGSVESYGQLLSGPGAFVPPERRRVGMVFQEYALFPHMDVATNVAYGLPRTKDRIERVREALSLVGLTAMESRYPHELSGGQQQRVALARALAPEPGVLLLDEPFSNLDAGLRVQVRGEVQELLRASEVTTVFVTHDQEEALFMGDAVGVMNEGRLEQLDTPETIFHAPSSRFVAQFMGTAEFLPARVEGDTVMTEIGVVAVATLPESTDDLEAMVRPDDIRVSPSADGTGTVVSRAFQGAFWLYAVRLPSGMVVHSLTRHSDSYSVGTRVQVEVGDVGHTFQLFRNGRLV